MRKKTISPLDRRLSGFLKRVLRISKDTVRTLTNADLSKAAGGCPWFTSSPGTDQTASGNTCNCS